MRRREEGLEEAEPRGCSGARLECYGAEGGGWAGV